MTDYGYTNGTSTIAATAGAAPAASAAPEAPNAAGMYDNAMSGMSPMPANANDAPMGPQPDQMNLGQPQGPTPEQQLPSQDMDVQLFRQFVASPQQQMPQQPLTGHLPQSPLAQQMPQSPMAQPMYQQQPQQPQQQPGISQQMRTAIRSQMGDETADALLGAFDQQGAAVNELNNVLQQLQGQSSEFEQFRNEVYQQNQAQAMQQFEGTLNQNMQQHPVLAQTYGVNPQNATWQQMQNRENLRTYAGTYQVQMAQRLGRNVTAEEATRTALAAMHNLSVQQAAQQVATDQIRGNMQTMHRGMDPSPVGVQQPAPMSPEQAAAMQHQNERTLAEQYIRDRSQVGPNGFPMR